MAYIFQTKRELDTFFAFTVCTLGIMWKILPASRSFIAEKLAELRRQTIYMKLFHSHAGKRIAVLGVRR